MAAHECFETQLPGALVAMEVAVGRMRAYHERGRRRHAAQRRGAPSIAAAVRCPPACTCAACRPRKRPKM